MSDYQCRECGITHIEPGWEIDGMPLCWADDDLCSRCQDELHKALERDAARYRFLRNRDRVEGTLCIGIPPMRWAFGGEDLDRAVDADMGIKVPDQPTLEERLAACLADILDTPIMSGKDEVGSYSSPLDIRLGFFRPDAANRAAELLEEAGR